MFLTNQANDFIKNIFTYNPEEAKHNYYTHQKSTTSLYSLCIKYVANHILSYENQLEFLPANIRIAIYRQCVGDETTVEHFKSHSEFFGLSIDSLKKLQQAFKTDHQKQLKKIYTTDLKTEKLNKLLPCLANECDEKSIFIKQKIPNFSCDRIYEACYIHKALDLYNQILSIQRHVKKIIKNKRNRSKKHHSNSFSKMNYLCKIQLLINTPNTICPKDKNRIWVRKEAKALEIAYIFLKAQIARLASEASKRLNKSSLFRCQSQLFEIGSQHTQIKESYAHKKDEGPFLQPQT
jgi:hypothetical protein